MLSFLAQVDVAVPAEEAFGLMRRKLDGALPLLATLGTLHFLLAHGDVRVEFRGAGEDELTTLALEVVLIEMQLQGSHIRGVEFAGRLQTVLVL